MEKDKAKHYNLYYIVSEKLKSEEVALKSYYNMLFYIMKQAENYRCEGEVNNNEQK